MYLTKKRYHLNTRHKKFTSFIFMTRVLHVCVCQGFPFFITKYILYALTYTCVYDMWHTSYIRLYAPSAWHPLVSYLCMTSVLLHVCMWNIGFPLIYFMTSTTSVCVMWHGFPFYLSLFPLITSLKCVIGREQIYILSIRGVYAPAVCVVWLFFRLVIEKEYLKKRACPLFFVYLYICCRIPVEILK